MIVLSKYSFIFVRESLWSLHGVTVEPPGTSGEAARVTRWS